MRVLAIDDEPLRFRGLMKNFDIRVSCRAEEIVEYLKAYSFDVIFLDYEMLQWNGAWIAANILVEQATPVVVHTTHPHAARIIGAILAEAEIPFVLAPWDTPGWTDAMGRRLQDLVQGYTVTWDGPLQLQHPAPG